MAFFKVTRLPNFNEVYAESVRVPRAIQLGVFTCPDCRSTFHTQQKLAALAANQHGLRMPIRRYVKDTVCPACLLQFHNRTRIFIHLHKKSEVCRNYIMLNLPPITFEEEARLDARERQRIRAAPGRTPDFVGNQVTYKVPGIPPINLMGDQRLRCRRKHLIPTKSAVH